MAVSMAKTLGTPEIMRDRPFRRNSSAVAPCRWPIFALVVMMFLECVRAEVVNTQVVRKIDLTTQVAKMITTYTVTGVSGNYNFVLPKHNHEHLAYLTVTADHKAIPFGLEAGSLKHEGLVLYYADVGRVADAVKISVMAVYTDVLSPFPKEITQLQEQSVVYETSMLIASPYESKKQSTVIKLASTKILGLSDAEDKRTVSGDQVTYGAFQDVAPFKAGDELRVHYVNHSPFAKVTSCLREIEVSNWGNIAIEEHYDLVHAGAKLKGGFSRLDYLNNKHDSVPNPSFRRLDAVLPVGASDMYYRDNIGNVSTSVVRQTLNGVELSILSRFPMYGGWKNAWYQGYNLPTEAGLRHSGSHFTLELPFGPPFGAVWVEDLTVKVILPEGAHNVVATPPFESITQSRTDRYTFLDMKGGGRPVVIMKMKNVVKDHNVMLQVTYDFNTARMLVEPLLLTGFFLACFSAFLVMGRIDLRIRKGGAGGASTSS